VGYVSSRKKATRETSAGRSALNEEVIMYRDINSVNNNQIGILPAVLLL
jgi:hypothetical protein